jgi:hypothetical protein
MTQEPAPKRSRGGQPKPAIERKRNNVTIRVRDQLKADLQAAAVLAHRSLSEEIEFRLQQWSEYQRILGELETFKARMAEMRHQTEARMVEAQRQTEVAERYRAGWGKRYNPNVPGGIEWFAPGMHNIPQSGFISEEEAAAPFQPQSTLPPVVREAVHVEVQTAVREILEEAGLLPKKKTA